MQVRLKRFSARTSIINCPCAQTLIRQNSVPPWEYKEPTVPLTMWARAHSSLNKTCLRLVYTHTKWRSPVYTFLISVAVDSSVFVPPIAGQVGSWIGGEKPEPERGRVHTPFQPCRWERSSLSASKIVIHEPPLKLSVQACGASRVNVQLHVEEQ